jgi:hypothetical protein
MPKLRKNGDILPLSPMLSRCAQGKFNFTVPSGRLDGFGGLWFPSSRVQTRPKPLDFSDVKILSMPSFGGEVQ